MLWRKKGPGKGEREGQDLAEGVVMVGLKSGWGRGHLSKEVSRADV